MKTQFYPGSVWTINKWDIPNEDKHIFCIAKEETVDGVFLYVTTYIGPTNKNFGTHPNAYRYLFGNEVIEEAHLELIFLPRQFYHLVKHRPDIAADRSDLFRKLMAGNIVPVSDRRQKYIIGIA